MDAFFKAAGDIGATKSPDIKIQQDFYEIVALYQAKDWKGILQIVKKHKISSLEPQLRKLIDLFEIAALLNSGKYAEAKNLYDNLPKTPESQSDAESQHDVKDILIFLENTIDGYFRELAEKINSSREALAPIFQETPNDPSSLFEFYSVAVQEEVFDLAFESLYKIMQIDKAWNDQKALKAYSDLLKNPKVDKPLIKTYQNKLASLTM